MTHEEYLKDRSDAQGKYGQLSWKIQELEGKLNKQKEQIEYGERQQKSEGYHFADEKECVYVYIEKEYVPKEIYLAFHKHLTGYYSDLLSKVKKEFETL